MALRKHRRRSVVAHALLHCRPCIAGRRGLHRGSTRDAGWRLSGRTDRPRIATKIPPNCFTDRSTEAQGLQNQLHRIRIVRPLSVPDIFRTLKGSRKVAALCNGGLSHLPSPGSMEHCCHHHAGNCSKTQKPSLSYHAGTAYFWVERVHVWVQALPRGTAP